MTIDAKTQLVTLLGFPLEHSFSPLIHNTAFQNQGINMVYLCMPVRTGDLPAAVKGLQAANFVGSNVTIPHKEAIHDIVDEVSDRARAVGAVNTVVCRHDDNGVVLGLYGDNTDIYGFLEPLKLHMSSIAGESVVVLGSGGAARAVVYALLTTGKPGRLVIAARTSEKAERIAKDMAPFDGGDALCVKPWTDVGSLVRSSRLIVNTTPLGMHPYEDVSPCPEQAGFSPHHIIYDLIYNPVKTRLLSDAEQAGAAIIGGLDMLVHQAAASYIQWTGREMPVKIVQEKLKTVFDT